MYLKYSTSIIEIPKYFALILQGFQEGGLITTIGLYFGDRLFNFYYLIVFHLLILLCINSIFSKKNYQKSSRRQINTNGSLVFIIAITIYNLVMLYFNPSHLIRQIKMILAMVYFCSFWTFFTWYRNFRTVEMEELNFDKKYVIKRITNLEIFLVLAYDVIFEIGIAYLTFYNLFIL